MMPKALDRSAKIRADAGDDPRVDYAGSAAKRDELAALHCPPTSRQCGRHIGTVNRELTCSYDQPAVWSARERRLTRSPRRRVQGLLREW
jgi:hypothetical protein